MDAHLVEIGRGVFAFLAAERGFGYSNIGLVIDQDGLTVIDTSATPEGGALVRDHMLALTAELELPIKRVIITSSRVPFTGGGDAFRQAAFYSSDETSEELDEPLSPVALRALLPAFASAYHDDFSTRPITHTITTEAWITPSTRGWVLPGESSANLIVQVPGTNAVFAGALASFGVTPLVFAGDPFQWVASLERVAELGQTIIPGHGSVGGTGDIVDLADYLRACISADGDVASLVHGPWDAWTDRRFDEVNVERAARVARGDYALPRSMMALLGW